MSHHRPSLSLDLPILTEQELDEVAMAKKSTAGGLDGWAWNEVKALSPSWFVGLALVLRQIEAAGRWPQGLLDAYIAMIPKAEGDGTPLGQRPLSVLPVVYRLWATSAACDDWPHHPAFPWCLWQAWQEKVAADSCKRKGFRGVPCFDIYGSHQLLASSHLRERDKMLLRAILSGGVWNGFLLSKVTKEDIRCRFCNAPDNDGHLLGDCTFLPCAELRNNLEFLPLMKRDRTEWSRCLLWHGWLPGLTSPSTGSPWAVAASDLACHNLEKALGPYPLSTHSAWHPFWDQDDAQDMVDDVPVHPDIWTDGTGEPIPHLDVEVAGAGPSSTPWPFVFDCNQLGHAQDLDGRLEGKVSHLLGDPWSSAVCPNG